MVHELINKYCPEKKLAILDAGCGGGKLAEELQNYGEVTGIDPSPEAIEFCKKRGLKNLWLGQIENYQPDKKFDCVVALDILEHCENDKAAIKKINDILNPDGIAIIFVPALKTFWSEQDEISHHYRRYTYKELQEKFKKQGFKIPTQSYFNFLLAVPIWIIRKTMNLLKIKSASEIKMTNEFLNKILEIVFSAEIPLLKAGFKFPFGVSLMGVYKKSD